MVGLEGMDAVEVMEVVVGVCLRQYTLVRMTMSRVTSNSNTFSCNLFKGCMIIIKYIFIIAIHDIPFC